jgi:hypothetical protein
VPAQPGIFGFEAYPAGAIPVIIRRLLQNCRLGILWKEKNVFFVFFFSNSKLLHNEQLQDYLRKSKKIS